MGNKKTYDFRGYATRNDLKCSDGRTIRHNAFADDDGKTVPLVWQHLHNDPTNILGHAVLENRNDGVYATCYFNNTKRAIHAKEAVVHGDLSALSIYATDLKQTPERDVIHGSIKEVSLVMAGANPGAFIESVTIQHGLDMYESDDEAVIKYVGDNDIQISHSAVENDDEEDDEDGETVSHAEDLGGDATVAETFETLTENQKIAVYAIIAAMLPDEEDDEEETEDDKEAQHDDVHNNEGGTEEMEMTHNIFESQSKSGEVLYHGVSKEDMDAVIKDIKTYGSLKESALQHGITVTAEDTLSHTATYGIENVDWLFPEARNLTREPMLITRDMEWVSSVINAAQHTPFSRIKSMFADLTEDDARAKGYIKGKQKKDQVFSLLKRSTTPTMVYKRQKMDRDDIIDITDFDVVAFLKREMRFMLNEELARAVLVGDGRPLSSDDKINEQNIRPIWSDDDFYTIKKEVVYPANATDDQKAKAMIRAAVKARVDYKGSGSPTLFTTENILTDLLLIENNNGERIYKNETEIAQAMRVSKIVTVPVMEGLTREVTSGGSSKTMGLLGIIVNMRDYTIGADKGGEISMFDDFDINFNQQLYLIETKCSGALTKPYSAIALETEITA